MCTHICIHMYMHKQIHSFILVYWLLYVHTYLYEYLYVYIHDSVYVCLSVHAHTSVEQGPSLEFSGFGWPLRCCSCHASGVQLTPNSHGLRG